MLGCVTHSKRQNHSGKSNNSEYFLNTMPSTAHLRTHRILTPGHEINNLMIPALQTEKPRIREQESEVMAEKRPARQCRDRVPDLSNSPWPPPVKAFCPRCTTAINSRLGPSHSCHHSTCHICLSATTCPSSINYSRKTQIPCPEAQGTFSLPSEVRCVQTTVSHLAPSDASDELVRNELVQLLLVCQMIFGGEI